MEEVYPAYFRAAGDRNTSVCVCVGACAYLLHAEHQHLFFYLQRDILVDLRDFKGPLEASDVF